MESTESTDGGRHFGHLDSACTVSTNNKTNGQPSKEGSRTRWYVKKLQEYLNGAKSLNDELVSVIPENGLEAAIDWYEEQLDRVEDAKLQANADLDDRAEEISFS